MKERCIDCKEEKEQKEFMVNGMFSIRCNDCRNKLLDKKEFT